MGDHATPLDKRSRTAIPWLRLAGALTWGLLIKRLAWTSRFIPAIGWLGFAGALKWSALVKPLAWTARLIPGIGWAVLAGQLAWSVLIKPLGWDEWLNAEGLRAAWNALPTLFMSDKVKQDRPAISETPGFEALPEPKKKAAVAIDEQVREGKASGNLATDAYTRELQTHIDELTSAISALEARLEQTKDGPMAEVVQRPINDELDGLREELAWAREEAQSAAQRREELSRSLEEATGPQASQGITEDALTRALEGVKSEAGAKVGEDVATAITSALAPLTQAMREGAQQSAAPAVSVRPQVRPEPQKYEAPQPNVTVDSTFTSSPRIDVNVGVSMPVQVIREQKISNREIAAEAGRHAGAETERAVRRGLDDAANVEG